MSSINPKLLTAIVQRTGLSKPQVYKRIQQVAQTDFLPRELAAIKVGAEVGLAINKYASSEELGQLRQAGSPVAPPTASAPLQTEKRKAGRTSSPRRSKTANQVFVVHGRDTTARKATFDFIRSLGVKPIEWTTALKMTKKPSPYVGEILAAVFSQARAVVVLLTPDDLAQLRDDLVSRSDPPFEKRLTGQARPNVLFEAGMAFASHPDKTVLLQLGKVRPFSDTAGRHVVHMTDTPEKRRELATKLENAGCDVDTSGTDWLTAGDFGDPEIRVPKKRKKRRQSS